MVKGYWNDEEKTSECIDADGWMHTEDLYVLDFWIAEEEILDFFGEQVLATANNHVFYPARDIRDEEQRYWSTIRLIANQ